MRLWNVRTGQCLKTWEFPTAVKRVAWSEDDSKASGPAKRRSPELKADHDSPRRFWL